MIIIISVVPKGRSFTANSGTKDAGLPRGRSSTTNSGTKVADLLGMNRCGRFPLFSAPHSLFNTWTDIKRSEKIPRAATWRWGKWIWITGPSGPHQNSSQGLNICSMRGFTRSDNWKFQLLRIAAKLLSRENSWFKQKSYFPGVYVRTVREMDICSI